MFPSRLAHLLVVVVSVFLVAQAAWLRGNGLFGRQLPDIIDPSATGDSSSSSSPSATPTPTSSSTSSEASSSSSTSTPPSSTPTTSSPRPTPPTSSPQTPSSTPAQTTPPPQPVDPTSSTSSTLPIPGITSTPPQSSSVSSSNGGDSQPSSTVTPVVITTIEVVTRTNSDGLRTTESTTRITTSTPGLNSGDSAQPSGMSTKTRNTVIGVVVGVGGAIVLGALALVAWRIWGRNKKSEESDGLMDYNMNLASQEKSETGGSIGPQRTPFQSTLENYHQPTNVNASSNF